MSDSEKDKLLQTVQAARRVALKKILEKVRNEETLTSQEHRTLKEYEEDLQSASPDPEEEDQPEGDKTEFKNALEISTYLESKGWKVSKSTLYKHLKEAKLRPDIDNTRYSLKAVLRYARAFLVTRETRQKLADDEIARKKARKELEKLEEEIKRQRIKRLAEEGSYIPREAFELELAARAAVLEADATRMIQTEAGRFIELVGGEPTLMGDLIREMREGFNRILNEFATVREYHVLFEKIDESAAGEKHEP